MTSRYRRGRDIVPCLHRIMRTFIKTSSKRATTYLIMGAQPRSTRWDCSRWTRIISSDYERSCKCYIFYFLATFAYFGKSVPGDTAHFVPVHLEQAMSLWQVQACGAKLRVRVISDGVGHWGTILVLRYTTCATVARTLVVRSFVTVKRNEWILNSDIIITNLTKKNALPWIFDAWMTPILKKNELNVKSRWGFIQANKLCLLPRYLIMINKEEIEYYTYLNNK